MTVAREIGDRQGEASASWNLGAAYQEVGDLPRAIAALQVLVDFEREIGHPDADKHGAEMDTLRAKLAREQPAPGPQDE